MVVSRKDVVGYIQNSFGYTTGDEGAKHLIIQQMNYLLHSATYLP